MTRKNKKTSKNGAKVYSKLYILAVLSVLLLCLLIIFLTPFSFRTLSDSINEGVTKHIEMPLRKNKAGIGYYSGIVDKIGKPQTLTIERIEDESQVWNGYHVSRYYYGSGDREEILKELINKASSLGLTFNDTSAGTWFNPKFYPERTQESRWLATCNEASVEILVKEQKREGEPPLLVRVYVFGDSKTTGESCPDL